MPLLLLGNLIGLVFMTQGVLLWGFRPFAGREARVVFGDIPKIQIPFTLSPSKRDKSNIHRPSFDGVYPRLGSQHPLTFKFTWE